jgi:hypothetical protein
MMKDTKKPQPAGAGRAGGGSGGADGVNSAINHLDCTTKDTSCQGTTNWVIVRRLVEIGVE